MILSTLTTAIAPYKLYLKRGAIALLAIMLFGAGWCVKGRSVLADQAEAAKDALQAQQRALQTQHETDIATATGDKDRATAAAQDRDRMQFERDLAMQTVQSLQARLRLTTQQQAKPDETGNMVCDRFSADFVQHSNAIADGTETRTTEPTR